MGQVDLVVGIWAIFHALLEKFVWANAAFIRTLV